MAEVAQWCHAPPKSGSLLSSALKGGPKSKGSHSLCVARRVPFARTLLPATCLTMLASTYFLKGAGNNAAEEAPSARGWLERFEPPFSPSA